MRIAIVGAGLSGVCTAYELAAAGHEVIVFERRGSVAEEASFAASGLLAPALALPGLTPSPAAGSMGWRWARRQARRAPAQAARETQALQLARLGHQRLVALRRSLGVDDEAADGVLMLLREARQLAGLQARLDALAAAGLAVQVIDAAACRQREPGLNAEAPLHGGLVLGPGSVGNGRLFAQQLRAQAQRLGVAFRFHSVVNSLRAESRSVLVGHAPAVSGQAVRREAGDTQPQALGPQTEAFDAVVLCAALGAAELLQATGQPLPTTMLTDATLTLPLRVLEAHPELGPQAGLLDAKDGTAIARIGQRVRVTGPAGPADHAQLHRTLQHWFPGSVQQGQVQASTRQRLAMPDGLPVLGASGLPGVWLHLAQGGEAGQGWGLACGAARVLADAVSGLVPELDISALSAARPG
jgi:D-amino-acid dehydrogenase